MERLCIAPNIKFGEKWQGWGEFLGTGKPLRVHRSPEEWAPVADQLARDNGGKLQCANWLEHNGYSGIIRAMQIRPEMFEHLVQHEPQADFMTLRQSLDVAERLAEDNGGKLPNTRWLKEHKYGRLVRFMHRNAKQFTHIEKERLHVAAEDRVPDAERLARDNGGKLQSVSWLIKNKHAALADAMRRRPELFAHIPQETCKVGRKCKPAFGNPVIRP